LRHRLHASRAGTTTLRLIAGFESHRVDALWEVQELLEVCEASLAGETVHVQQNTVAFAGPCTLCIGGHRSRCFGVRITSNHFQVLGERDLGGCFAKIVVRTEPEQRNWLVCLSGISGVEHGRDPVYRQIVRVVGVGASFVELSTCVGGRSDGVGALE
jgi:hypothetical protein